MSEKPYINLEMFNVLLKDCELNLNIDDSQLGK